MMMATDEQDLEMLRRILPMVDPEAAPVPDDVLRIAEGLFLWKSVAADIAALEASESAVVGFRGVIASTRLSCALVGGIGEVEIEYFGADRLLVVDLGESTAERVRLRRLDDDPAGASRDLTVEPDDAGVCRFADVPAGRVFLVFERSGGALTKTEPLLLA
jgi:hypothetical protein